jgi:hypothetical protein
MRPDLSKSDLGEATRQMICARLMLHGVKVFRPLTEDTPIDLLILRKTKVLKCQCKYIFPGSKNAAHQMNLFAVRKWGPKAKAVKHVYKREEVDFFLGYCLANDKVYVFPYDEVAPRQSLTLWIVRAPQGRCQHATFDHRPWENAFHLLSP